MKYIEAKIFTNSRGVEEVTAELLKMGIEGATVEDPDEIKNIMDKKEGYEWDYVDEKAFPVNTEHKVIVYFDASAAQAQDDDAQEQGNGRSFRLGCQAWQTVC